jgi:hypothetical protein
MSYVSVDCEFDGPVPGLYSMVCFGAVIVEPSLTKTFYGRTSPISKQWIPEALAISGFSREEHEKFEDPKEVMLKFYKWVKDNSYKKPILISDNNGVDASWINYYMHCYVGDNPFGWSSRRVGDLYCGAEHDLYYRWKKHRKTNHNHNPLFDAMGNAEAFLYFFEKYKIKLPK